MSSTKNLRVHPLPRLPALVLLAFLAAAVLAACAPGADSGDEQDTVADDDAATDEEEIVLRVVDARAGESQVLATYDRLDEEFEERNPGVTVERESMDLEELQATIPLRLDSGDAPDVSAVNQGHGTLGRLVQAGLVTPLDDYAEEFGWRERQSEVLLDMNGRFTEDGQVMGEGDLYAISDTGAPVGIYYNEAHLDDLGLDAPETWEDVETALDVAQEEGLVPMMFGNVDAWPGIHFFQLFLNDQMGREGVADFVYGAATLGDAAESAAGLARSWVTNGWLADGWEGIDYDTSWQQFGDGAGLFFPTGSWVAADLREMNEDIRFMLMPPSDGGPYRATASGDFPMAIPTNADHPELAAEYINFRLSEDAADIYVEDGHIPTNLPENWEELVDDGSLHSDVLAAWAQLEDDEGMAPYLDWTTPDFYEVVTSEIQRLLGGSASPEAFVEALNQSWAEFHDEG